MQQRVKCLLVDDLEENLLALSALLRRDDVEVLTARSGSEARRRARPPRRANATDGRF